MQSHNLIIMFASGRDCQCRDKELLDNRLQLPVSSASRFQPTGRRLARRPGGPGRPGGQAARRARRSDCQAFGRPGGQAARLSGGQAARRSGVWAAGAARRSASWPAVQGTVGGQPSAWRKHPGVGAAVAWHRRPMLR